MPPAEPSATLAPVQSTATVALPSTPLAGQVALWVDPRLPAALQKNLVLPSEVVLVDQPEKAALRLEPGSQQPVSRWVYALAAAFATELQGVTSDDLKNAWRGKPGGSLAGQPLLVDESTQAVFTALWGAPASGAVKLLPPPAMLDYAWGHHSAIAILPFESLEPRWKVLDVDGQSPLRKDFDPAKYALSVPVSLDGSDATARQVIAAQIPPSNRDPHKLTVVAMTGVTALVRATAFTMEQRGVLYPGRDVRDWLRDADLIHVSNEVPFAKDCPFPNPVQPDMRFCSDPRYIELLEDIGTNIVELTGDHFQDWGANAMLYTLDLYRQRGWQYYGGGANLAEGRKALLVENNGNRLAFIGCNGKGGSYAQASAAHPGAAVCDYAWMAKEVARLRKAGYLPIVTFQYFEYYSYKAQPNQERDFRLMADAGAVIVSGSQAHQPQAMEFRNGAFIHYGLGNLFFDQYDVSQACRQGFIDRHVFYDGRYIGTELLPILFVDYARPRPMTPGEQNDLLRTVFRASGW
jgi:poly-gamma-glutamate synthesis protein (capsule biosynthesis protein)